MASNAGPRPAPKLKGPDRPGRPEFITFDAPTGLAVVFMAHVTGIEGVCVNVGTPDAPQEMYGVRFIHAPASGIQYQDKLDMTLAQSRKFVSFLIQYVLPSGPIVVGKYLDIDTFLYNLAEREKADAAKASILGPDGQPASAEGPKLVTLEQAAAEGMPA